MSERHERNLRVGTACLASSLVVLLLYKMGWLAGFDNASLEWMELSLIHI